MKEHSKEHTKMSIFEYVAPLCVVFKSYQSTIAFNPTSMEYGLGQSITLRKKMEQRITEKNRITTLQPTGQHFAISSATVFCTYCSVIISFQCTCSKNI